MCVIFDFEFGFVSEELQRRALSAHLTALTGRRDSRKYGRLILTSCCGSGSDLSSLFGNQSFSLLPVPKIGRMAGNKSVFFDRFRVLCCYKELEECRPLRRLREQSTNFDKHLWKVFLA